jgi:hypothetical protein
MVDRAQTETLGFVLVFALITASIGIVYASGFNGLNDARQFEQVNNAERAFEVFGDNVEDMIQWNAPSRSTEIKLAGATLTVAEAVQVRVNASGTGLNETYDVRPIVYDADTGERVVYVQGAVLRESGGAAVVQRESAMLITSNRTMLPIIQTRLVGTGSVGGSATVLVRATHSQTKLLFADDDPPTPVWFNVTTPRTSAWIDHLESKSGVTSCVQVGDTAACRIDTKRIHVTLVQIDIDIES